MVTLRFRAFSLIELLVVISIVSVLLSLLLPSLKSARELASRTKCLAATRQVALACQSYATSARGYMPSYLTAPGNSLGSYTYGVQHQLTSLEYLGQDIFTNRGCPEGPTTYSSGQGSYYYGQTPGTVGIGVNDLLQTGYSYVNPPSNTYWSPGPSPTYYPNQGPYSDRSKRLQRRPEMVMVASCCLVPSAAQIPVQHTAGITDAYFVNQPIPGRHNYEGTLWTFYDGHGKFLKIAEFTLPAGYSAAPYPLWEWTWRTMYHAAGMDD